jgi:hypothetical protein
MIHVTRNEQNGNGTSMKVWGAVSPDVPFRWNMRCCYVGNLRHGKETNSAALKTRNKHHGTKDRVTCNKLDRTSAQIGQGPTCQAGHLMSDTYIQDPSLIPPRCGRYNLRLFDPGNDGTREEEDRFFLRDKCYAKLAEATCDRGKGVFEGKTRDQEDGNELEEGAKKTRWNSFLPSHY